MGQYLGIDLGSSALKCLVVDEKGTPLALSRISLSMDMDKPGYLEQDPNKWWLAAQQAIPDCLKQLEKTEITAISFSGHMSAPVLLDKNKNAVRKSILIADSRGEEIAERLNTNFRERFLKLTGNAPINAFAAARLLWISEHEPDLYDKTEYIIFAKDYLRFCMCGEIATEPTDAGNSLLYDHKQGLWDFDLIKDIGLDTAKFSKIISSASVCGHVTKQCAELTGLKEGTPIISGAADMACSQAGSGAFSNDVMAITLSTSIQIVEAIDHIDAELIGKNTFHAAASINKQFLMSSIFSGGMSIDWFLNLTNKGGIKNEDYERVTKETERLYLNGYYDEIIFLPFLTGSGSPWFRAQDSGMFYGLRTNHDEATLLLSILEGISFNIKDNVDILAGKWNNDKHIYLAGGGSRFPIWSQLLADVLDKPIHLLNTKDTATLGAAMIASIGIGDYKTLEECFYVMNGIAKTCDPQPENVQARKHKYKKYKNLLNSMRKTSVTSKLEGV